MGKGSCSIDYRLLERAGIREFQHIEIYDVENGERLTTYAISSQEQGEICLHDPAAASESACEPRGALKW